MAPLSLIFLKMNFHRKQPNRCCDCHLPVTPAAQSPAWRGTVWEALTEKVQRCELTTEAGKDNSIVDVPLALYNFRNKAAVNKLTIRYLNRHKKAPIQIVGACVTRLIFFLCVCIRFSFNRYLATTRTPARSLSWEAPPCFLNSCL